MDELQRAGLHGLALALQRHTQRWRDGVELQRRRIEAGHLADLPDVWVDVLLFPLALRNLLRACWRCQVEFDEACGTNFGSAVDRFLQRVPATKKIRDLIEHFDRAEKDEGFSDFVTWEGSDDGTFPSGYTLHLNDHRIDLDAATQAAEELAVEVLRQLEELLPLIDPS